MSLHIKSDQLMNINQKEKYEDHYTQVVQNINMKSSSSVSAWKW